MPLFSHNEIDFLQSLLNSNGKRRRLSRSPFALQKKTSELVFNAEIAHDFMKTSEQVVKEMAEKSEKLCDVQTMFNPIRNNLISIGKTLFPNSTIEIHFFGSRIIGLASDASDLDIFMEIDGNFCEALGEANNFERDHRFRKLASAIQTNNEWIFKKSISKTSVPIVICVYSPMKVDCKLTWIEFIVFKLFLTQSPTGDINIVNGLSTENSKLVGHLFKIQPEAVLLYHYIRQWTKLQGLDFLKGYTITLLLIFYLQKKNLMPSVESVQAGVPKKIISGQ